MPIDQFKPSEGGRKKIMGAVQGFMMGGPVGAAIGFAGASNPKLGEMLGLANAAQGAGSQSPELKPQTIPYGVGALDTGFSPYDASSNAISRRLKAYGQV